MDDGASRPRVRAGNAARLAAGITVALAGSAGATLLGRWLHANTTTIGFVYLVVVLLVAVRFGLVASTAASLAATACYNFFFLPPVGTFTIADPQNWLALFAFLVTAIIASRLSHRARNQAKEARSRQQELEILFRLSRELLQTENVATLVSSVPSAVASVTGARSGILYLLDGDRLYRAGTD